MNEIALVGFSVNAEIVLKYERMTELEKGKLESIVPDLCGTSANVARAITLLGQSSKVLALTGINNDFEGLALRFALEKFPAPFTEFRILNNSHISILPIDGISPSKVFGKKGNIENGNVNEIVRKINQETGLWRIATGVRSEEVPLVKELFNKHIGYRSLNPRPDLILNRGKFLEVLQNTDLLIMDYDEFGLCEEASVQSLLEHGPKLVIVTKDKDGGLFASSRNELEKYKPCKDYLSFSTEVYQTGGGDWFHAAFIVKCMELGKSIHDLTVEEIRDCISFAARVSGKKITMPGAANGPSKTDI